VETGSDLHFHRAIGAGGTVSDTPLMESAASASGSAFTGGTALRWNSRCLVRKEIDFMAAKAMTKSEIAAQLAEKVGITEKQASQFFLAQAELAYKQAKNTFTIPGIGKLVMRERPARSMVMLFGPDAGKEKTIPKKKVVKFRLAKAAKDAILGNKK
jgi:DNA-binding protein HU-beta